MGPPGLLRDEQGGRKCAPLFLEMWQEGFQLILFPLLGCWCFNKQLQCGEEMNPTRGRDELWLKGNSGALNLPGSGLVSQWQGHCPPGVPDPCLGSFLVSV